MVIETYHQKESVGMVVVRIAGVSIPDVEERNHTDGVGDPETTIRAGNSRANCVAVRDIPGCLMRFYFEILSKNGNLPHARE